MRVERVLLLGADGLTAYRCHGGEAIAEADFPTGDLAGFEAYLRSHAGDVCALLADVCDESFELVHVPHVRGRSHERLLARKQADHCHGSPLCVALLQGRRLEGRRDDRVLLAALTRAQAVEPWLRSMERVEAALCGVYSLPQLVPDIVVRRAGMPFLVTTLTRGGLRQTFVADGCLRFSRLTPLSGGSIDAAAAACAAEAANMRRYLCGQRLAERDAPLPVLVLAHPAQTEAFRRCCRDSDELRFDYLDLVAESARQHLATPSPDSRGDALFVHMLARHPPRRQFAPAAARRQWRLRKVRRAIDTVGWAACVTSLLFAAAQLPQLLRMREAIAELQARNDGDERVYRSAQQGRTSLALPAADLRDLAAALAGLERLSPGPGPLLARLSHALDHLPAMELESLEWRIAGELEHDKGPFAVLDVHATVPAEADPHRRQRSVEQLAGRLEAAPAIRAIVLKPAAAMESDQAVTSADLSKSDGAFSLRVVQKL